MDKELYKYCIQKEFIKETGKMVNLMVKGQLNTKMEQNMKAIFYMAKKTVWAF